ncbi:MAG: hypothetical protein ACRDZ4_13150 [Egibacteraceae bacterium]
MKKCRRTDDPYVLQVFEDGRWQVRGQEPYPRRLIEIAQGYQARGERARVMHGDVEVGMARGPVF